MTDLKPMEAVAALYAEGRQDEARAIIAKLDGSAS